LKAGPFQSNDKNIFQLLSSLVYKKKEKYTPKNYAAGRHDTQHIGIQRVGFEIANFILNSVKTFFF
jgi:hypothetical protein